MSDEINSLSNITTGNQALLTNRSEVIYLFFFINLFNVKIFFCYRMNQQIWPYALKVHGKTMAIGGNL